MVLQKRSCRRAMMKIVNHLMNNNDKVLECWSMLQNGSCKPQVRTTRGAWDRTVHTVGRLPKYWKGQWLVRTDALHIEPGYDPLTQADVEKLDSQSPEFVASLFYMITGTTKACSLPVEMRCGKAVCTKVFQNMHRHIGEPLKSWKARCWPKAAMSRPNPLTAWAYELVFNEEGKAASIKWFGAPESPVEVRVDIDKSFTVTDPWDTWKAKASGKDGQAKHVLCDLWKGKDGLRAAKPKDLAEQLTTFAVEAATEVQKAQREIETLAVSDDVDFVGEDRRNKRKAAMTAAVARGRETENRRKTISLT